MHPLRADMILSFLSKASLIVSFYGLYWVLEYIGWMGVGAKPSDFGYFMAANMLYLLYFISFFALSIVLDLAARHAQVRAFFTHIERGSRKKGGYSEAEAIEALLKKYPHLRKMLEQEKPAGQEQTTTEQPQEKEEKKPKSLPLY